MTNNWQTKRLDEISTVTMGQSPSSISYNDQGVGVPFFQGKPSNIDSFGVANPYQYTTEPTKVVEAGTALMTVRAPVGDIFTSPVDVCIGRGLSGIKANADISQQYLNYQLQFASQQFHTLSQGSTFTAINSSDLKSIKVGVPNLIVQQKIASILSFVDEAIQKTDQIIQKTEELKRGMMDELLTNGIGHTKFKKTKLGEIPEGWEILTLQEMIDTGTIISHLDGNHGELYPKASEFTEEGIPYISAVNLSNGKVDFDNCKFLPENRARQFKKGVSVDGDVLFAHNATVGPVGYLRTTYPFVILSTSLTYYRCDSSLIVPKYVLYYMQSTQFITQYKKVMSQTTRNQVPITAQRKLYHLLPSKDEQTEIANILDEIDKKIHLNRRQYSDLVNLKNGLMHDIFSQKVTIN